MMVNDLVVVQEACQVREQDLIQGFLKVEVQEWVKCKWEHFLQVWRQVKVKHPWEDQWAEPANNKIRLVVQAWVVELV
jgi:hypothetical protein